MSQKMIDNVGPNLKKLKHWISIINPFSAGIDFRRQNLTSLYARF